MGPGKERHAFIRLRRAWEILCALLLFLAITINMAEIVLRVGFRLSYDLFFDLPVWITIWALLLITGLLLPEEGHISIDFIRVKFKGRLRWLLEVFLALTTLCYGVFITWNGVRFLQGLYTKKSVFPRSIPVSTWLVELCVPIGMFIFSVFAVIALIQTIRKRW
jgi:TRAP-type C4-dicarboxylate transport system permease small subunit